jgi:hypothetical protein
MEDVKTTGPLQYVRAEATPELRVAVTLTFQTDAVPAYVAARIMSLANEYVPEHLVDVSWHQWAVEE